MAAPRPRPQVMRLTETAAERIKAVMAKADRPIAAVRDGDTIVIDPTARTVNLEVSAEEIARRMADWRAPASVAAVRPGSVHDKYIRLVSSAHYGCVL